MIKKVARCLLFLLFYCYLLLLLIIIFSFCGEGGWVASKFCNLCLHANFAVPPRVRNEARNVIVAFDSTFKKECYLRGDPQVSVNWTKDGVLISKNNFLVIRQATLKDKGYYECTARNDYGEAKNSFWIDVTGKFHIVVYVIDQACSLTKRLVLKFKPNLNRPIFFSLFTRFL